LEFHGLQPVTVPGPWAKGGGLLFVTRHTELQPSGCSLRFELLELVANQSTKPTSQGINQPTFQPTLYSTNQSTNQPINQTNNQTMKQPSNLLIRHSTSQPTN